MNSRDAMQIKDKESSKETLLPITDCTAHMSAGTFILYYTAKLDFALTRTIEWGSELSAMEGGQNLSPLTTQLP